MLVKILLIAIAVLLVLWIIRSLASASYRNQGGARKRGPDRLTAEETQKCPTCGTYVAVARPQACGRSDCRYPVRRSR